jgi:hypothetical protein
MRPSPLFELEELPSPEIVDGCFQSVIQANRRLRDVLELAPPGWLERLPRLRLASLLLESDRLTVLLRTEYQRRRK